MSQQVQQVSKSPKSLITTPRLARHTQSHIYDIDVQTRKESGRLSPKDLGVLNQKDLGVLNQKDLGVLSKKDLGVLNQKDLGVLSKKDLGLAATNLNQSLKIDLVKDKWISQSNVESHQLSNAKPSIESPKTPSIVMSPELANGFQSFAKSFNKSVGTGGFAQNYHTSIRSGISVIDSLNPGNMTAYMLKLNVEDPNNSVETHNALSQNHSQLRQAYIEKAKKDNEEAQRKLDEAEALANILGIFSCILGFLTILATVASLAASTAAQAASTAASQAANEAANQAVQQATQQATTQATNEAMQQATNEAMQEATSETLSESISQSTQEAAQESAKSAANQAFQKPMQLQMVKAAGEGVLEAKKASLMVEANEYQLSAMTWELYADESQKIIKNEGEIIQQISRNINEAFTTAIQSLHNQAASQLRISAASLHA